jgi:hypothetical protein
MQEREHVKTTPGEPKAPEVVPHPVRPEPGASTQSEDINIPLVTLMVSFFAVALAVLIVGLQAWFYNYDAFEREAKQVSQGAPGTELGAQLAKAHRELYGEASWNDRPGMGEKNKIRRISIDRAMTLVSQEYGQGSGKQ